MLIACHLLTPFETGGKLEGSRRGPLANFVPNLPAGIFDCGGALEGQCRRLHLSYKPAHHNRTGLPAKILRFLTPEFLIPAGPLPGPGQAA
jgi:hypothetical protein